MAISTDSTLFTDVFLRQAIVFGKFYGFWSKNRYNLSNMIFMPLLKPNGIINQSAQGRGVAGRAWDCKGRGMETDNIEGNWDSGESDTAVSGKEWKEKLG